MLQGLEVLEAPAGLGMGLEVVQRDLLLELAAELDMDHYPLGSIAARLRIVVRVLGVKGGFCEQTNIQRLANCGREPKKKDALSNHRPSALSQSP